jgi:glycosidase
MKSIKMFISAVLAAVMFSACAAGNGSSFDTADVAEPEPQLIQYQYDHELNIIDDNYRNYYEVFLYSYCDSNGDGIGDINGLISKLDYINDMGFNGIWLMPVMQSTTYHKYDVIDYYTVDKEYGTNEDFINLADECHKRGIKLIIDMVINHTSAQNEWFKSACQSLKHENCGQEQCIIKNCVHSIIHTAAIIILLMKKPTSNDWYSVSGTDYYYEGILWDQMPDLNLDNEQVWNELEKNRLILAY